MLGNRRRASSRRPFGTKMWLFLMAALFAALASSAAMAGGAAKNPPLIIGAIEDRSGPSAVVSKPVIQTLRVQIPDINKRGGILKRKVVLITEDDQGNPTLTPALVRRLIDRGARAVIMASGSASAVAAKPVLKQTQRIGIAPTNISPAIVTPPDNEWSFSVAPSSGGMGLLYGLAWKALGIKKVAFLADQTPTITGAMPAVEAALAKLGIEVVAKELVPMTATDASPQVLRIQQARPDAVFVQSLGNQLEIVEQRTLKRLMPNTPRFGMPSLGAQTSTWALAQPSDLDGLVYTSTLTAKNPRTVALTKLLKSHLGKSYVITDYNAQAYAALQLLQQAFERAGSEDPVKVRDALESTRGFKAPFGQPAFKLSYGPERHFASAGVCGFVLSVFKGNKPGGAWPKYQPRCS